MCTRRLVAALVAALCVASGASAQEDLPVVETVPDAPETSAQARSEDGAAYSVSTLRLAYRDALPFLEPLAGGLGEGLMGELQRVTVELGETATGFTEPFDGAPTVTLELGRFGAEGPVLLHRTAIDRIAAAVTAFMKDRPLGSTFFVGVPESDIDPVTGEDRRPGARGPLRMLISFEGRFIAVSSFNLRYAVGDHPQQVPVDEILAATSVELARTPDGLVPWRPGAARETIELAAMGDAAEAFSAGALQAVLEAITGTLTERGQMAVQVIPARGELDPSDGLADLRSGRTRLDLVIVTGLVREIRSVAMGDRIDPMRRINANEHAWIRRESPVQPFDGNPDEEEEAAQRTDLLQRDRLDGYLFRLSRHPGRRADAAIAPSEDQFGVVLDYMVSEINPLTLYAQAANTGTESTNDWRYRAGLFDNQLTGHDDVLSLEWTGAGAENNAVLGSYEAYVGNERLTRWRAYGSWSEFEASEVGFANEFFTGTSTMFGGEIIWNFHQDGPLFWDFIGGARYLDTEVDNAIVFVSGQQDFLLPYIGVGMERYTEIAQTTGRAMLEFEFGDVTNVDANELNRLGRFDADADWVTLRWDLMHSFYLEPVLAHAAWADVSTPQSSTLAHEFSVRFRGQYAFEHRLIPQMEQVAGGMYSVRGYAESVAVGDNAYILNLEYRYHLPRAFALESNPRSLFGEPFRFAPQQPYGRADWDLILRGFLDVGRTEVVDPFSFESDETLVGTGVGVQFLYRRNLDVRVDWGFALEDVENRTSAGSSQVHISATVLY